MMNLSSHELDTWRDAGGFYDFSPTAAESKPKTRFDAIKLFADKLKMPSSDSEIARPRLIRHLEKSLAQFSATLIAGRAGIGKTLLAADFARRKNCRVAWYKAETADADWRIFSSYLLASVGQNDLETDESAVVFDESAIPTATETIAARFSRAADGNSLLIVLDDLHSVFDANWFTEFFNGFVRSLAPNAQLLLIARTLPPLPLWRLRSKQVLGVLDEKMLTCTLDEASELFRKYQLSSAAARSAHKRTYGRIIKLREIAEKKSSLL